MRKTIIAATLGALLSAPPVVGAEDASRPALLEVNGEPVSRLELDLLVEARATRGVPADEALESKMRDELVTRTVLAQAARELKLHEDAKVRAQNRLNELAVLAQAYLRRYAEQVEVGDSDLKSAYDEYLQSYDPKEYHVRQILVRNEVTAKEMIARLKDGADFAELASEHSIDPGAAQRGGDIGWFRPDTFVDKRFSKAVEQLAAGEYTDEPVQTKFGWHVIKVEEGPRDVKFPAFDELSEEWKEKMRDRARMQKVEAHVAELSEQADVSDAGIGPQAALSK